MVFLNSKTLGINVGGSGGREGSGQRIGIGVERRVTSHNLLLGVFCGEVGEEFGR
jgi:hypothetical protein